MRTDGDFAIKVYRVEGDGSLTLVRSEIVAKASWMPNIYGSDGYITANASTGDPETPDSYDGSYNQVDQAKVLHSL